MLYFVWMRQMLSQISSGWIFVITKLLVLVYSSFCIEDPWFCWIRLPSPSECDLYYVNRDTLFSYHRDSELFLQVMHLVFQFSFPGHFQFTCLVVLMSTTHYAADDGPICCFSLQELSKWSTTNGRCSSSPLVCATWYVLCLLILLVLFSASCASVNSILFQVLLMSQKIIFLIFCALSRFALLLFGTCLFWAVFLKINACWYWFLNFGSTDYN